MVPASVQVNTEPFGDSAARYVNILASIKVGQIRRRAGGICHTVYGDDDDLNPMTY